MYREIAPCLHNSSYSLRLILLKPYTLEMLLGWSEDRHVRFSESCNYFLSLLLHFYLRLFLSPDTSQVYREYVSCPGRKAEGHCFRLSVVHYAWCMVPDF